MEICFYSIFINSHRLKLFSLLPCLVSITFIKLRYLINAIGDVLQ